MAFYFHNSIRGPLVCMKRQTLFSGTNQKTYFNMLSVDFFPIFFSLIVQLVCVNIISVNI